jgi:small-conductance mechanosensitive channel
MLGLIMTLQLVLICEPIALVVFAGLRSRRSRGSRDLMPIVTSILISVAAPQMLMLIARFVGKVVRVALNPSSVGIVIESIRGSKRGIEIVRQPARSDARGEGMLGVLRMLVEGRILVNSDRVARWDRVIGGNPEEGICALVQGSETAIIIVCIRSIVLSLIGRRLRRVVAGGSAGGLCSRFGSGNIFSRDERREPTGNNCNDKTCLVEFLV